MRMIGLIGGMSWESTAVYYKRLNETVRARLGGLNSANVLLRSVNFDDIVQLQKAGKWAEAAAVLAGIASDLEKAGAESPCAFGFHGRAPRKAAGRASEHAAARALPARNASRFLLDS